MLTPGYNHEYIIRKLHPESLDTLDKPPRCIDMVGRWHVHVGSRIKDLYMPNVLSAMTLGMHEDLYVVRRYIVPRANWLAVFLHHRILVALQGQLHVSLYCADDVNMYLPMKSLSAVSHPPCCLEKGLWRPQECQWGLVV